VIEYKQNLENGLISNHSMNMTSDYGVKNSARV
jgi:hypothetical protein